MKKHDQRSLQINRVVILGASGFIGGHLRNYCMKQNPQLDVIGFSYPEVDLINPAHVQKLSRFLTRATAVVMLSCIKPNISDDLSSFRKNVTMVINLCQVLHHRKVARFLYMSSAAVYGEDVHNTNISETTPVLPRSYYGLAKYISEKLLWKTFSDQHRKGLVIFRPPVIYGPGEGAISYNPAGFLHTVQTGNTITLWGDGSEKREFIYIDDIIELIHYFIFHPFDGVINIASGTSYSFQEIITIISKFLGKKITIQKKKRSKEKVDHVFNNQLLKKLVPNLRFTTVTEGLIKLL